MLSVCACASVQGVYVCVNEMTIIFTYALICVYDMPERKIFLTQKHRQVTTKNMYRCI